MTGERRLPALEADAIVAAEFHELKNQLAMLTLSLEELAATRPDLTEVLREPRYACELIVDRLVQILTLYKNDRGQLALNVEAYSPADVISEATAAAASLCTREVAITSRVEAAPPFWFFDRYLVQIALSNALHNSLKFARSHIAVGVESSDGGVLFYVHDDSAGYSSDILQNQGQRAGTTSTGTGLGLYFARAIAEAHVDKGRTGNLRLENRDGARFSIWLP